MFSYGGVVGIYQVSPPTCQLYDERCVIWVRYRASRYMSADRANLRR
jgi:hypothetical protein